MHIYLLSPVIFQLLFNAIIWNIMADYICGYYLNSAPDNFVILSVFRRMHPTRWYV